VHGIDAAAASIAIAKSHAAKDPLLNGRLTYSCMTAESLLASSPQYDVVCALEIVEHVTHPPSFIHTIAALVKPGGLLFMSTINKTTKSYLLTILGAGQQQQRHIKRCGASLDAGSASEPTVAGLLLSAAPCVRLRSEYVLHLVPVGTHDWQKFITPSTLTTLIHHACHPARTTFRTFDNPRQPHTPAMPKSADAAHESIQADGAASSAASSPADTPPHTLGFKVSDMSGMIYNPLHDSWRLDRNDTDVNYILVAARQPEEANSHTESRN
jgi:2-polyprenyl-3-methyl-5-hydroxy-6-metoxy-1,4-benzoquinol methylase